MEIEIMRNLTYDVNRKMITTWESETILAQKQL